MENSRSDNEERVERPGRIIRLWNAFKYAFSVWFFFENFNAVKEYVFRRSLHLVYRKLINLWVQLNLWNRFMSLRQLELWERFEFRELFIINQLAKFFGMLPSYWYLWLLAGLTTVCCVWVVMRWWALPALRGGVPLSALSGRVTMLEVVLNQFYNLVVYYLFSVLQEHLKLKLGLEGTAKQLYVVTMVAIGFYLMSLVWRRPYTPILVSLYHEVLLLVLWVGGFFRHDVYGRRIYSR